MEEYSRQVLVYDFTDRSSGQDEGGMDAVEPLPAWVHILYLLLFILGSSLVCYLAWQRF